MTITFFGRVFHKPQWGSRLPHDGHVFVSLTPPFCGGRDVAGVSSPDKPPRAHRGSLGTETYSSVKMARSTSIDCGVSRAAPAQRGV